MMLDTAQKDLNNKEIKDSKIIEVDDYLVLISSLLQKKISLNSNIAVALDIKHLKSDRQNLTEVRNVYLSLSNFISKIEIPDCIHNKIIQFTISLKDNFTLTVHLDCKLNASEIDQVIKIRHENKVINYLYSELNSYFKIIVPIKKSKIQQNSYNKRDH